MVAAIERLGQLATAGPASSEQVEPSSDVCRCCHRLLTCSPPPTWATCHQPPEAAPASTSATLQPDFRNHSSEVQEIRKGVERDPTMGILVVCGETKLLGKGQADWQIVRMMEYKKRINIRYPAKCPFRCGVREEIGVSAAWRGISLWGNDVSPLVVQPVPRKSPPHKIISRCSM